MNKRPIQHSLTTIEAAWNAAGTPWSPPRLAAIYAPDALFFGGRPGQSVGAAAIQQYFESYNGVIIEGSMQLVKQQVLEVAPGCQLAQGYVQFRFLLADGRRTESRLRTTLLLVESSDTWKIRQHHFSTSPDAPPLGN
jgi:uncharacterized protein (TIGR02246 family)